MFQVFGEYKVKNNLTDWVFFFPEAEGGLTGSAPITQDSRFLLLQKVSCGT